jgi:cyanophycinase-like exopeptidase
MQWFLRKARGGDVIVFRNARNATSTSQYPTADAYNPYFYSELGVTIDSCETIFLNSRSVGNDLDVSKKVRNAEAIFFTGGDQAFYWDNIKGTLLEDALNYAVNVKKIVIGKLTNYILYCILKNFFLIK